MISYLSGRVMTITADTATVLVHDAIGYEVHLPAEDIAHLSTDTSVELHCYHHITDRAQALYGFVSQETKFIFTLLIAHVTGVGPKSALTIVSKIGLATLQAAITAGTTDALEQEGISKKISEKILVGLKGRVAAHEAALQLEPQKEAHSEVIEALVNLGYKKAEVTLALQRIDAAGKNTEEVIKEALRQL